MIECYQFRCHFAESQKMVCYLKREAFSGPISFEVQWYDIWTDHLKCHSSSTALGTRTGYWKPTQRGTDEYQLGCYYGKPGVFPNSCAPAYQGEALRSQARRLDDMYGWHMPRLLTLGCMSCILHWSKKCYLVVIYWIFSKDILFCWPEKEEREIKIFPALFFHMKAA